MQGLDQEEPCLPTSPGPGQTRPSKNLGQQQRQDLRTWWELPRALGWPPTQIWKARSLTGLCTLIEVSSQKEQLLGSCSCSELQALRGYTHPREPSILLAEMEQKPESGLSSNIPDLKSHRKFGSSLQLFSQPSSLGLSLPTIT